MPMSSVETLSFFRIKQDEGAGSRGSDTNNYSRHRNKPISRILPDPFCDSAKFLISGQDRAENIGIQPLSTVNHKIEESAFGRI